MSEDIEELSKILFEEIGLPQSVQVVSQTHWDVFGGVVPAQLAGYWKEYGFTTHANGLVRFIDPQVYDRVLKAWLKDTKLEHLDDFHAFVLGPFGTLCAFGVKTKQVIEIDCIYARCNASAKDFLKPKESNLSMESFLLALDKERLDTFSDDESYELLFESALQRLGPLEENEIYGFEPVLALGGKAKLENLQKVRADVHLAILRELSGPPSFPFWGFEIPAD